MSPAIMLADGTLGRLDVKLTEDDVREIRNEAARGVDQHELVRRFAVSRRELSDILAGKTWPDPCYIPGVPLEGGSLGSVRRPAGEYKWDPMTSCMDWLGRVEPNGLPVIVGCSTGSAARAYYEAAYGEVDVMMNVTRRCGNRLCVNPRHGALILKGTGAHRGSRRVAAERREALLGRREQLRAEISPLVDQARQEQADATTVAQAVRSASSLDYSPYEGASLHGAVSADDGDPLEEIDRQTLAEMLDGLDEDRIATLSEDDLLGLRERLLAAGYAPSTSQAMA